VWSETFSLPVLSVKQVPRAPESAPEIDLIPRPK